MTQTLYTITDRNGSLIAEHQSVEDAMSIALRCDSHDFEIRHDGDMHYILYVTQHSRASTLGSTPMVPAYGVWSDADTLKQATHDIACQVVAKPASWHRYCEVMTDETYLDQMHDNELERED